jgi:hypothetical protein
MHAQGLCPGGEGEGANAPARQRTRRSTCVRTPALHPREAQGPCESVPASTSQQQLQAAFPPAPTVQTSQRAPSRTGPAHVAAMLARQAAPRAPIKGWAVPALSCGTDCPCAPQTGSAIWPAHRCRSVARAPAARRQLRMCAGSTPIAAQPAPAADSGGPTPGRARCLPAAAAAATARSSLAPPPGSSLVPPPGSQAAQRSPRLTAGAWCGVQARTAPRSGRRMSCSRP